MRRALFVCLTACLLIGGHAHAQGAIGGNDDGLAMPPTDVLPRPAMSSASEAMDTDSGKRPDLFMPTVSAAGDGPAQSVRMAPPGPLPTHDDFTPMPDGMKTAALPPPPAADAMLTPLADVPQANTAVPMAAHSSDATVSNCQGADDDCLRDQDAALRKQLETKRLGELKAMRDTGTYSANRAKARAYISLGMSDDARRELACDKARKLADQSDKDGNAAWYACDVQGLQAALSSASMASTMADASPPQASVAPLEAVTAEAAN